MDVGRQS